MANSSFPSNSLVYSQANKQYVVEANSFSVADVVYRSAGSWTKANANTIGTAEALGVIESCTGSNFTVVFSGTISLPGLTDGAVYFLSDTVAGQLSTTEPTTIGSVSRPIVVATSTTTGAVMQYRGAVVGVPLLSLSNGKMLVGNASNQAAEVSMSSDATISNDGAVTIASNAIITTKIINEAVTLPKIASTAITSLQRKNLLINGSFDFWQRGSSWTGTSLSSAAYTADRWYIQAITNGANVIRTSSPSNPLGTGKYAITLGRTNGSGDTSGRYMYQVIESSMARCLASKIVTLSFWAKAGSNFSGASNNLLVQIRTGTGADQGAAAVIAGTWTGQANSVNTTVTLTTSWQRYSVTSSALPSNCAETGIVLGYTPTGTAGADDGVDITGVQLEISSIMTDFEYVDTQPEFARCLRFCRPILQQGVFEATRQYTTSTKAFFFDQFCFPDMRTSPTLVAISPMSTWSTVYDPVNNNESSAWDLSTDGEVSATGTITVALSGKVTPFSCAINVQFATTLGGSTNDRFEIHIGPNILYVLDAEL